MSALPGPVQHVIASQQAATQQKIAMTVLAKQNDAMQAQGEAAVSLVEQAAQLGKAIGAGGGFDAQA